METLGRGKLPPMRRILIIARKEFSDAVISKRLWVLIAILFLFYVASTFLFMVPGRERQPPEITDVFMGANTSVALIAPFLGIAFGYDAIARERESGTLRILLSRPVYREDVLNGKIISSLAIIGITLFASTFLAVSATIFLHGIPVDLDDISRLTFFSAFSLMFAFAYYALSLLFSTLSNKSSRPLIASIALWVFFAIILPIITMMITYVILGPPPIFYDSTGADRADYWERYFELNNIIQIFSINHHYTTLTGPVLTTGIGALDIIELLSQHPISIAVLILYPTVSIMLSYIAFTRREEK